jgi:hypothetical protein
MALNVQDSEIKLIKSLNQAKETSDRAKLKLLGPEIRSIDKNKVSYLLNSDSKELADFVRGDAANSYKYERNPG